MQREAPENWGKQYTCQFRGDETKRAIPIISDEIEMKSCRAIKEAV